MEDLIYYAVMGTGILFMLVTGLVLIQKGRSFIQDMLTMLGTGYLLVVVIFLLMAFFKEYVLIYGLNLMAYVMMLEFTRRTFYKGRKSHYKPMLASVTATFAVLIGIKVAGHAGAPLEGLLYGVVDNGLSILATALTFCFLAVAANNAYKVMNTERDIIQPWILARLRLIVVSCMIMAFLNVPDMIAVIAAIPMVLRSLLQVGIVISFALIQFLAWTMPARFKAWLNRKHSTMIIEPTELHDENEIVKEMTG